MATTDDLVISIRADLDTLNRQLQQVDRRLNNTQQQGKQTGQSIDDSFSGASDAVKKIAAAIDVAVAAMGAMAVSVANNVREFNSLANSLGLSYTQLERLQSISSKANLETDMMIDLAKTLNEQIGEAANGNKDFEESFSRLGLSMDDLLKMSVDEQLLTVAGALSEVTNQADKAQIGATLFGDNWLPALKLTEQNVKELADQYDKFGQKLDDTDVTRLIELDKAFDGLVDNVTQISKKISSDLAPALTVAIDKFNEFLGASKTTDYEAKISLLTDITIQFSGVVVNVASVIRGAFELIGAAIGTVGATLGGIGVPIYALIDGIASSIGYIVKGYQELYNVYALFNEKEPLKLIEPPNGALVEGYIKVLQDVAGTGRELLAKGTENFLDGITGKAGEKVKEEMEAAALAMGDASTETKSSPTSGTSAGDEEAKKKAEERRKAAQEYLKSLAESNMTELQLNEQKYIDSTQLLDDYLKQGAVSYDQFFGGILDAIAVFNSKKSELEKAQADAELKAILDQQAREDDARTKRLESISAIIQETQNAGMTELERMDAQHAAKMAKIEKLMIGEEQFKDELRKTAFDAEAQHQSKKLDMILGTGNKIQEMTKAFNKSNLQGAIAFFAADFGGFSQHSRKMFELNKAARLADAAIVIPSTVMDAYAAGAKIGGPVVGAAFGAAALASQLANLRQIQAATFGGGGGGGGGGGAGGGSSFVPSSNEPQQQAPVTQRFVNVSVFGEENTMYSRDSVLKLMQRIGEEVKDGAVLRVV